jgi:hypothetical protein
VTRATCLETIRLSWKVPLDNTPSFTDVIWLCLSTVREAIAAKLIAFYHVDGVRNPADILSKYWVYQQVWKLLRTLLFWRGDTIDVLDLEDAVKIKPRSRSLVSNGSGTSQSLGRYRLLPFGWMHYQSILGSETKV